MSAEPGKMAEQADRAAALPDEERPVEPGQRILLFVSYDGSDFSGFWRQANARTVAGELQSAIWAVDPAATIISCASRTDAGVHARNQPVSFVTQKELTMRGWVLAMAARLPEGVCVTRAARVPLDFDPRRDPLWKRYCYRVRRSQVEDPFLGPFSWRVGQSLDLSKMKAEAATLVGTHDFAAFRSIDDNRPETLREMRSITLSETDYDCLNIEVTGNRFMYNMVRIIAGTLVDVGRGKLKPGAGLRAIASGNRRDLGMTAPARGLTLEHVELRTWGSDSWPARPAPPVV